MSLWLGLRFEVMIRGEVMDGLEITVTDKVWG